MKCLYRLEQRRVNNVNVWNLYTATGNFVWFVLCYALLDEYMLPVSFVTCFGRVYVTFFLLEESYCSRLGTLPFPLVFGFRKMISVGCFQLISSGNDGCGTFCVLLYSFSRRHLFCTGSGLTVPIACGLK